MVNVWEMTPWAYMAAELVLRECWWVGFDFVSCVLLCSSLLMLRLLAPRPLDTVVTVLPEPMEASTNWGAAGDFILPPSLTSLSNAGSRNPPPLLSSLLIHQLRTVPKVICNGKRLGDDAMGVQGS